jgi:hypothetical protein
MVFIKFTHHLLMSADLRLVVAKAYRAVGEGGSVVAVAEKEVLAQLTVARGDLGGDPLLGLPGVVVSEQRCRAAANHGATSEENER